jgi:ADP-ribosylglycohydrolase
VLGAAIGDAMGHPTEFMSMEDIRAAHGPQGVAGFTLWWTHEGKRFAPYTDDTQISEAVILALLQSRAAARP